MSFKNAKPIDAVTYLDSHIVYVWDDTNPKDVNFKKVLKDYQAEINEYNGCDLKSLIEKNIIPNTDKQPIYVDETIYKNLDVSKLHELSQFDIFVDDETGEITKQEVINENKTSKSSDKYSSQFDTEVEPLSGEKK